ncbi:MAG: cysteine methyltransferase, partial [Candidatus Baltobacteraceae bacterium]
MTTCILEIPFGRCFEIVAHGGRIVGATFRSRRTPTKRIADPLLREAAAQTGAYFARELAIFDLPLHFSGTPLQCEAWRAVSTLGFGHFV